jgi:hypothetical protein
MKKKYHWSVRWIHAKWPWVIKAASIVVAVAGGAGTVWGVIASCSKAVDNHDEAIRVKVRVEEERVQRDKKIDDTLKFHGQQIWTIEKKIDKIAETVGAPKP